MRERVLTIHGDTQINNLLGRYREIVESVGFEKVFEEEFESRHGGRDTLFAYGRRDGLILSFDTYGYGENPRVDPWVNSGHLWYNWLPETTDRYWTATSSGFYRHHDIDGKDRSVWIGDHDCRETLLRKIKRLEDKGSFLTPWVERPSSFLIVNYVDWDRPEGEPVSEQSRRINQISEARIAQMPEWVREIIGPKYE